MEKMSHETAIDYALAAWDTSPTARHGMEAAIRAYLDARGLLMVPREMTADMRFAVSGEIPLHRGRIDAAHRAMLAAAPDPFGEAP